jgi:hypothetical protein
VLLFQGEHLQAQFFTRIEFVGAQTGVRLVVQRRDLARHIAALLGQKGPLVGFLSSGEVCLDRRNGSRRD